MKNKIYKVLPVVLYVLSFLILLFCVKNGLNSNIYLNLNAKLMLLSIVCIFIYIAGFILVKKLNYDKKILKINLVIFFLIYIFTVCTLTLFDEIYGRNGLVIIDWDEELLDYYLNNSFNIIPFKTIKLFTEGYINGIVSFKNFSTNIFGNICAFMPFAIFLPLLFNNMNKYWKFLITMIVIVVIIELLQFTTLSGACEIDDLILNVVGSSIIYFIIKIKCINRFIRKFFFLE